MTVQNPQTAKSNKNLLNNASTAFNSYKNYTHSYNTINNISKAFQVYLNPELPQNPPPQGSLSQPQNPTKLTPSTPQNLQPQAFQTPALTPKPPSFTQKKTTPVPTPATPQNFQPNTFQSPAQPLKPPNIAHQKSTEELIKEFDELMKEFNKKYGKLAQNLPTQGFQSPPQNPTKPSAIPPKSTQTTPQNLLSPSHPPKPPGIILPKPTPPAPQAGSPNQGPQIGPQSHFTLKNPKTIPTPKKAAITLQRAFRYSRPALKKAIQKQQPLSDQAALELNLQKRGLPLPSAQSVIPRPEPGTYAVDPKKAKDWVSAHPPEARKLAKQFLSCITYRSQKKFEKQLKLTIQDFNRHLASMPADKRGYIILVDNLNSLNKSDGWVQLLALKYLMTDHLVKIVSSVTSTAPLPSHNILICDDGAYSGDQMSDTVLKAQKTGKKVFLAIPFMTLQSKKRINPQNNKQIHICKHQIIFTLKNLRFPFGQSQSAFIFNHKVADFVSIPNDIIKNGCLLSNIIPNTANNAQLLAKFPPSSVTVPFINNPNEEPPYKVKSKL